MNKLIEGYDIGPNRARNVAENALIKFSEEDVRRILAQLESLPRTPGSNNPCGPVFNRYSPFPMWMNVLLWSLRSIGIVCLLPIEIGAAAVLLSRGRFAPIWKEIPRPSIEIISWASEFSTFIKAPLELVESSIEREAALCVNRSGQFSLKSEGYTVMSHVWGETMGWQTPDAWGPVDLQLRKKGIPMAHFTRFFDRCEAEWLWVDVIAMPEVLEDMDAVEKEKIERLRIGVINCLRSIYTRSDKVVVLDTLLLRLNTRSPIDVAVTLCLSFWMTCLWTWIEARLAPKVIIKTANWSIDLDTILELLGKTFLNEEHRYYGVLGQLWTLREETIKLLGPVSIMESACIGCVGRFTSVKIDIARALYPLLGLTWEYGWNLEQGFEKIVNTYPGEDEWVMKFREIKFGRQGK
ncbi:hypothetical protein MFRU_008g02880 [Monilinia fructicola]|uniref:Heterokaryon incompatibility domain-containing protein n=1 Tax=Monilinia fructicola TaxID=38448 RepID=A0A5M9JAF8_MONFR|nr:hypothetical protein EYC84_010640 [Monilinia fructicola]KAG4031938.1 hypothetical protein MFRU_008g02880 [Monilinia fructicola]